MNVPPALPFEDSRRLTGANLFFASTGAVLEVVGVAMDDALIAAWRARVGRMVVQLGWVNPQAVSRPHQAGTSLAVAAPGDQLLLATELNEWALCAALVERDPVRWQGLERALLEAALRAAADGDDPAAGPPPVLDEAAAWVRFARLSTLEAQPRLRALLDAAATRGLPRVVDESLLSLGSGARGRDFALDALPGVEEIDWQTLGNIPTAIVTGSNGKTTTVRLLAAIARAHGWHTAYNCTDGVFLDAAVLAGGDYSGPAGARWVMRERRAQAAILETARGGILRRGIAVSRADVAVITNVSADHFGEYGIDDLEGVAAAKFAVAAVVASDGLLVLNADDAQLRAQADGLARRFGQAPPLGWFSGSQNPATLRTLKTRGAPTPGAPALGAPTPVTSTPRAAAPAAPMPVTSTPRAPTPGAPMLRTPMPDAPTCGVRQDHLVLSHNGSEYDLGPISEMPLSMNGSATYNIANMAGAALAAAALGIPAATIAAVLARFGANLADNPGRLMRFERQGVQLLVDYAHNADGLRGLLTVAARIRGETGRLGLLLGQAGNRQDADIAALAHVVAEFRPDLVVVKENETQLRGRAPGEVPGILRAELERLGFAAAALPVADSEIDAARRALAWAQAGDVLVLPLHSSVARATVVALLQQQ